jgi:CubicO group peptidase (beta-lactamase class C family)
MTYRSAFAIAAFVLISACASAPPEAVEGSTRVPGVEWEYAEPGSQGFSAPALASAVAFATQAGSTSGLVVHGGLVVAAWGDVSRKSNLHSVRKSFASALVGIAVARGSLRLDDTLEQFGIDDEPPSLSADEQQATLRMLLEARSGVYHRSVYETTSMKARRPVRHSHPPGTFWYYNNWDFNAVGAILERTTGESFFDELKAEIAAPIGMQDYQPSDGHYVADARVTRFSAYPFAMSARDLARFALLYLQGGRWGERQIVPETWVSESTAPHSDTEGGGYGFLWWTNVSVSHAAGAPLHPAYWAEGHIGQFAVVVPSLDLVVVSLDDPRLGGGPMRRAQMMHFVSMVEAAQAQHPGLDGASAPLSLAH